MKINIKREGGFMGMISKASIDFNKMPVEEQQKFQELLDVANSPKPEKVVNERGSASMMRDSFQYSFTFKQEGKTVKYKFDDMTAPPQLVELFQKYCEY